MTLSIVARDAETGQLGVAVQTAMFAAGAVVPWARPGVGVVASQAISESAYGPRCLDALERGCTANEALAEAEAADPMAVLRQVGVVGADGSAAAMTGAFCIEPAGHIVGDGVAVQANMTSSPDVWPAMAASFRSSGGGLARRLYEALVAGAAAGGDARGVMSAALLVVEGTPPETPGGGHVADLRVDRSEDPLAELARLLDAADAYAGFGAAVEQLMAGDADGALVSVDTALALLPGDQNLRFVRAGALAGTGASDAAADELRALVAEHPTWEVAIRGFADKGLLTLPDGVTIDGILERHDP